MAKDYIVLEKYLNQIKKNSNYYGQYIFTYKEIYSNTKKCVLLFEEYLKEYDLYIVGSMCPTEFKKKWGCNAENQISVLKNIFGDFPSN